MAPTTTVAPTTVVSPPPTIDGPVAGDQWPVEAEPYTVPVPASINRGWGDGHGGGYAAADVFADCGSPVVAPTNGLVAQVLREDRWDPDVDDPATRGGLTVSIVGDDGVRYYLAHLESIADGVDVGVRVGAGREVGRLGVTGRSGGCHVHLGISPPCEQLEWAVRRGVVFPQPYLDAWADGRADSPAAAVTAWATDHPTACADAA